MRQHYLQPDEPTRVYITCLEALLKKLKPMHDVQHMIEVLHEYMLPTLKTIVRKEDRPTITDLLD